MTEAPDVAEDHSQLQSKIDLLLAASEHILRDNPGGLTEHQLLKTLESPGWGLLKPIDFRDPARLYPVHFLLFHALYGLQARLHQEGETLMIGPLSIRLVTTGESGHNAVGRPDPLARFYGNLDNLKLERTAIEEMLDRFWQGMTRATGEDLGQACQRLELPCPPPDLASANRQFRRLAMTHHPDRGGRTEQVQRLNQAIAVVRRYFHRGSG